MSGYSCFSFTRCVGYLPMACLDNSVQWISQTNACHRHHTMITADTGAPFWSQRRVKVTFLECHWLVYDRQHEIILSIFSNLIVNYPKLIIKGTMYEKLRSFVLLCHSGSWINYKIYFFKCFLHRSCVSWESF